MEQMERDRTSVADESVAGANRPLPDDFPNYLPWACNQLELEYTVLVCKIYQSEYLDSGISDRSKPRNRSKSRATRSRTDGMSDRTEDIKMAMAQVSFAEEAINVIAVYDTNDDLVEIMFNKNTIIPRIVIKTIGLILKFYPQLSSININQGADYLAIYELEKILPLSNITDMCFDDTYLTNVNFEILLDREILRNLSLSRCKIEDVAIDNIAVKLTYPNPASKSLYILNLSSNRITDAGAKCLANALRSNRNLTYLNLCGNKITDDGASYILDSLQEFCLTPEEVLSSRSRYIEYFKNKNILIASKIKELKEGDVDKTTVKKRGARSVASSVKKRTRSEREGSLHSVHEIFASNFNISDSTLLDKATATIQMTYGSFNDPFSSTNSIVHNEASYCFGNNTLLCLNLAYNDLSYISVTKLLGVLTYQKQMDRKPRGLINVCIDGNNLPYTCDEYRLIETIIDSGVQRNLPVNKKRQQSKVVTK